MPFLYLAVGLTAGICATWLLMKGKVALAGAAARTTGEVERTSLSERLHAALLELKTSREQAAARDTDAERLRTEREALVRQCAQLSERANRLGEMDSAQQASQQTIDRLTREVADLRETNGRLDVIVKNERTQTAEKLELLNNARAELTTQFKNLANEILEEKSQKFTEQNKTNLGDLLNPLKVKIGDFQKKVEDCYDKEGKDRSALVEQVRALTDLNNKLSQDAQNLASALKGDQKAQGNWGEIILEDILERAGLIAGQHYDVQRTIKSENGQTYLIPDVVLHLPGGRDLVIDSKFTLPDYRAFAAADDDDGRDAALKRHLVSIRSHMKGLCEKQYQSLYGLKSLDCVVMFVPLEPAFMLAVTHDRELFNHGWEKNVLLVSPSTLLFVIRTVANLWRQEDIGRNAQEISRRGGELYDKLVSFVDDLKRVGEKIDAAQDSFVDARKRLCEGKGNAIRQAEMLKELGVKPSKTLPQQWVDAEALEPLPALVDKSDS